MTLKEIQLSLMQCAAGLGDYQKIGKLELANGYCKADEEGDELKRSQYWSALLLRYFYKIYGWMRDSASCNLQPEDFFGWLNDSLCDAFYYRAWWWEYEAVVREGKLISWKLDESGNRIPNPHWYVTDPTAADKSINYFCAARRGKEYQALNKQKRKSNVLSQSIDAAVEDMGDMFLEQAGATEQANEDLNIKELVEIFLNKGRDIEALILDAIAYHNSFKETSRSRTVTTTRIDGNTGEEIEVSERVTEYQSTFDPRKLVRHLNSIDEGFMQDYFTVRYEIDPEESNRILGKLHGLNNTKLYNYIKKTLSNLKDDPAMMAYLVG